MNGTLTRNEALCELVEVMLSGGSDNLQALLSANVVFSSAEVLTEAPAAAIADEASVIVGVRFVETLEGETLLALTAEEAKAIVTLMTTGLDVDEADLLGEMGMSAVGEAMNQLMAGFSTSLGTRIGDVVHISPPTIDLIEAGSELSPFGDDATVVRFEMSIDATPHGSLYWVMEDGFATALVERSQPDTPAPEPAQPPAEPSAGPVGEIGALGDISLTAVVELGRATLPIRTMLGMGNGSVIRLGRHVDEPADLYVNGTLAAKGDIVLVDGKLGLRVSEVLTMTQGGN